MERSSDMHILKPNYFEIVLLQLFRELFIVNKLFILFICVLVLGCSAFV